MLSFDNIYSYEVFLIFASAVWIHKLPYSSLVIFFLNKRFLVLLFEEENGDNYYRKCDF